MKFFIDMPLSPAVATWLQNEGYNAIHAQHCKMDKASDFEILQYAKNRGMVIITADLDYPRLLALSHASSPGVILFRKGDFNEKDVISRLQKVFEVIPVGDLTKFIIVVEKNRIRKRELPILFG